MNQYHDLLKYILDNGELKDDRTGVGTYSVFGYNLRLDLRTGFPAITTKKLAWKACVAELLWFLEGSGDERRLAELTHGNPDGKVTIWTPNANSLYWKPRAKYEGDLGRVYGVQWRHWVKYTEEKEFSDVSNGVHQLAVSKSEVDQLSNLLDGYGPQRQGV